MYTVPLDDYNYHTNSFTPQEKQWARTTYQSVISRYKDLPPFIDATLAPLHLTPAGKAELVTDITLAFGHFACVSRQPKTKEQAEKFISKWFRAFLPYIVENLLVEKPSHPIQYEPIALTNLYISRQCMQYLCSLDLELEDEYESLYTLEAISLLRAVHSSMLLLCIGDDVHGIALLRGVIELIAKIKFAPQFREEYVLFKTFNLYLQCKKFQNDPLPKEMTDYLKKCPEYRKNPESFLAYGWAKNKKGQRHLTLKEFLKEAIISENLDSLFQLSSEFVHEDYVGIGYDYPALRKALTDRYFMLFFGLFQDQDILSLFPKTVRQKIKVLIHTASPLYTGELPLPEMQEASAT